MNAVGQDDSPAETLTRRLGGSLAGALLLLLMLTAEAQAQDFDYTITNGTITTTGYTGPGGAVTIPSAITGLPVMRIGGWAFDAVMSLTSVTIPDTVTSIGREHGPACSRAPTLLMVTILSCTR